MRILLVALTLAFSPWILAQQEIEDIEWEKDRVQENIDRSAREVRLQEQRRLEQLEQRRREERRRIERRLEERRRND